MLAPSQGSSGTGLAKTLDATPPGVSPESGLALTAGPVGLGARPDALPADLRAAPLTITLPRELTERRGPNEIPIESYRLQASQVRTEGKFVVGCGAATLAVCAVGLWHAFVSAIPGLPEADPAATLVFGAVVVSAGLRCLKTGYSLILSARREMKHADTAEGVGKKFITPREFDPS